ncbi:type II toxin-antitoxin system PemK/MazF family toxin [Patescibacteria group bacterium]|nr:type II toxin-antitoxin system PemK/MazF family toxin [Patescibacteria group bacterium]MBU2633152.1 type II toxin-antitoxin system PemK/MazF family toxin [Patescibacteria group bacterium]
MYKKGKIVLIPFPFTDLSGSKVRPAVVVSDFLQGDDAVVSFISSLKVKGLQKTDLAIKKNDKGFSQTGLKTDSVVKVGKIATLDKKTILGEIGGLSPDVQKEIDNKIKILFGL